MKLDDRPKNAFMPGNLSDNQEQIFPTRQNIVSLLMKNRRTISFILDRRSSISASSYMARRRGIFLFFTVCVPHITHYNTDLYPTVSGHGGQQPATVDQEEKDGMDECRPISSLAYTRADL
jgi:hypothetical protein